MNKDMQINTRLYATIVIEVFFRSCMQMKEIQNEYKRLQELQDKKRGTSCRIRGKAGGIGTVGLEERQFEYKLQD